MRSDSEHLTVSSWLQGSTFCRHDHAPCFTTTLPYRQDQIDTAAVLNDSKFPSSCMAQP